MAKKVHVGQLWRTQRGHVWQVSALYRPVVAMQRMPSALAWDEAGWREDDVEEHPVYGEEHAVMYCEMKGQVPERHVPVSHLTGWRWNWKPVE